MRLLGFLSRWSSSVRASQFFLLCVVPVVLMLPAMVVPPTIDDLFHTAIVNRTMPWTFDTRWYLDLFVFFDGLPGRTSDLVRDLALPWWTSPAVKIAFVRPFAAATHWLDIQFGLSYAARHLVNMICYALLCVMVWQCYRTLLASAGVALLAAVLFAFDLVHLPSVIWIANRNALLALIFGAACLVAHHRWRQQGQSRFGLYAGAAFAASILCAEAGIATGAYVLAYALFFEKSALSARARSVLPYLAIFVVWYAMYKLVGAGAAGNDMYVDPGQQPGQFLLQLLWRAPLYFLMGWSGVPSQLYYATPSLPSKSVVIAAWLVVLVTFWLLWPLLRRQSVARFFLAGSLLAILPIAGSLPSERNLAFVSVGFDALLALVLCNLLAPGSQFMKAWDRKILWPVLTVLLLVRVLLHPLAYAAVPWMIHRQALAEPTLQLPTSDAGPAGWVFINPPSAMAIPSVILQRVEQGLPVPTQRYVLARDDRNSHFKLTRTSTNALQLEAEHLVSTGAAGRYELLFRSQQSPLREGEQFHVGAMTATVEKLDADGWPARAAFQWLSPLEDYRWFYWRDGQMHELALPAVGASVVPGEAPVN